MIIRSVSPEDVIYNTILYSSDNRNKILNILAEIIFFELNINLEEKNR